MSIPLVGVERFGIDAGTKNFRLCTPTKIADFQVPEMERTSALYPSYVLLSTDGTTTKVEAVGWEAYRRQGRLAEGQRLVRAIMSGRPCDEEQIKTLLINMVSDLSPTFRARVTGRMGTFLKLGRPAASFVVAVPCNMEDVHLHAFINVVRGSLSSELDFVYQPEASAHFVSNQLKRESVTIFNMGAGTFDVSCLWKGCRVDGGTFSVQIGGDCFDQDIVNYMRQAHNLVIEERQAEWLKLQLLSFDGSCDDKTIPVRGRHISVDPTETSPKSRRDVPVSGREIVGCVMPRLDELAEKVRQGLDDIPSGQVHADMRKHPIIGLGNSIRIPGLVPALKERIEEEVALLPNIDAGLADIQGLQLMLRDKELLKRSTISRDVLSMSHELEKRVSWTTKIKEAFGGGNGSSS